MDDSKLAGKQLIKQQLVLCASPTYLKKHGTPQHPEDLQQHNCLVFKDENKGLSFASTRQIKDSWTNGAALSTNSI